MFRSCIGCLIVIAGALLAIVPRAHADDLGLSLGVMAKLGGGGNLLAAPSDEARGPFDDGVGGYGITGGVVVDVRILKGLVGLETGFLIDSVTNWSEYDFGNIEVQPGWSATDLRIPLLFSVGLPLESRLSFGTGPEFVVPLSATYELGGDVGGVAFNVGNYEAETETHVNWLFNLGYATPVGPVRVSFDLRFALNLDAPDTYAERLSAGAVNAQHGMDLRLLLGVGYDLL